MSQQLDLVVQVHVKEVTWVNERVWFSFITLDDLHLCYIVTYYNNVMTLALCYL